MKENHTNTEAIADPSTDLFRVLVENAMDVISLLDESGTLLYQSPSVERVYGYTPSELMGTDVLALVHPEDLDSTTAKLGALLQKTSPEERHKLRYLHKNGEWLHIEVQARIFEVESGLRVVLTARDVSENHRILDELRLSNELFQTVFHASSNICTLSNFDTGEFIDVNFAFEKVLGWTREQAVSKSALELNIWGSSEKRELIMSHLAAEGKLSQFPFTAHSSTGKQIEVLINAEILMVSGSKCAYLSSVDVTETNKLEEQLRHSQKLEALGQLTGGIAHDFNNLLSVILGNSEIIQMSLDQDSKLQPALESILKATNRGAGLTHQLLAFSRKQALQPIAIALNEAIEHTVSMLNQSLSEDIEIQTSIDDDLWPIKVDPGQLENAILNLALNSRDAMPTGGTITIAYSNKAIDAGEAAALDIPPGDYVSLAFADTGSGMSDDVIQKVFEPFFTTKETGRGTGLGLSMVFGFVNQSGGHVSIQSKQNSGTTITVLLPRSETAKLDQPTKKGKAEDFDWQGHTALLVEDNDEVRKLTTGMLKLMGFDVLVAEDGSAAVKFLKQDQAIDFLLSDVILPGELKGPDIARLVRKHSPDTAILLMSGYAPEQIHMPDNDSGPTPIIRKPFTNKDLIRKIQTVFLDKNQTRSSA